MAPMNPLLKKNLSLVIYVAMAVVVAFLIIEQHPPSLTIGTTAPIDTELTLLSGRTTSFKALLRKPMVVNFWATWCPPCLKELPIFSKLAKKYRGRFLFLGASLKSDENDILAAKKRFLLDYELGTVTDQVADRWQGHTLPTTYVIDTQGKILWAHAGVITEEELEEAIALALGK